MYSVSMLARELDDDPREPMYPVFNQVVVKMCELLLPKGFDLTPHENKVDSLKKIQAEYERTQRVIVWSGGSANTIFGDPEVNYAFRAWHDAMHIWYNLPFSKIGEDIACKFQQRQIQGFCEGEYSKTQIELFTRILECEINGQVEYLNEHNKFPDDQRKFHREWMEKRDRQEKEKSKT